MKKKLFSVTAILFISFLIFLAADFLFAYKIHILRINFLNSLYVNNASGKTVKYSLENLPFKYDLKINNFETLHKEKLRNEKIKIFGNKTDKKSILLFGCSFADGARLQEQDSFGYLLSKYTNRNVYRLSYGGMGAAPALFQASDNDLYKYISKNTPPPEYAVYVYITYHLYRIYEDKFCYSDFYHNQIIYNQKNGKLAYSRFNLITLISRFALGKYILRKYSTKYIENNTDYLNSVIKKYFIQTRKELQKRYPDIKFIIIKYPVYDENPQYQDKIYNSEIWDELRKDGFIIYDLKKEINADLTQNEYILSDRHPSPKAWKIITPKFVHDCIL